MERCRAPARPQMGSHLCRGVPAGAASHCAPALAAGPRVDRAAARAQRGARVADREQTQKDQDEAGQPEDRREHDALAEAVRRRNATAPGVRLEASGRIVLLLDPSELLTRAERGLLDSFSKETRGKESRQTKP